MPDLPLPVTFREELIENIAAAVRAGESCALVGVGSSGKSNVARFLRQRADARARHFGEGARRLLWLMIDCNQLQAHDELSLYPLMLDAMIHSLSARSDMGSLVSTLDDLYRQAATGDATAAFRLLTRAVQSIRASGDFKIVFVLDDCDNLIQNAPASLLRRLRALRDEHKYSLMYVTITRRELHLLRPHSPEFETFYEIIVIRSFAVGQYSDADAQFMLQRLAARMADMPPVESQAARALIRATGGHPGLLKAAFFATEAARLADDPNLTRLLTDNSAVMDECRKIWDSLEEDDRQGLIEVVRGGAATGDARPSLEAKGLVFQRHDSSHAIFCPVFEKYVAQKGGVVGQQHPPSPPAVDIVMYPESRLVKANGSEIAMSRTEFELLRLLMERGPGGCSRGELLECAQRAETVEPSGLGRALDQILDRAVAELRRKLGIADRAAPQIVNLPNGGYKYIQ